MSTTSPCRPFLPPEWAPQAGVMLTWPTARSPWGAWLAETEKTFADIARHTSRFERVLIVCENESHSNRVLALCDNAGVERNNIVIGFANSEDSWARDHGPITVLCQNEARLLDFTFNGWGNKFKANNDNAITRTLHGQHTFGETPLERFDFVLEGGSIDVDGSGTLLTTRHCLMSPQRNPHLDETGIENVLKESLGVERILWLENGNLEGDDTDSHIDTLARFCNRDTIAYTICAPSDSHYNSLSAMEQELKGFRSVTNDPYQLVPLPLPAPIYNAEGSRLPATYANFLIINQAVLVPTYNDENDRIALTRLQAAFPDREIVPVDCRSLVQQYGSLHCVTMQLPVQVDLRL